MPTRPTRRKNTNLHLDETSTSPASTLRNSNNNSDTQLYTRLGTARHDNDTTRHDSTKTFPDHPADRPGSRIFCRLPFLPPLPTPRSCQSQPEPTITACTPQKSLPSPLYFFSALGDSVFYFCSARLLNRALPPELQLRSIPNRVGPGLCYQAGAPSRELGVCRAR
jgi:hypothetical protein